MDTDTETAHFRVTFKSNTFNLDHFSFSATIADVKEFLSEQVNLPVDLQKLLYKGRILSNDQKLADLKLGHNAKMMLMGTSAEQRREVEKMDNILAARRAMAPKIISARPKASPKSMTDLKYTFHRITVIEEFPEPERARQLLIRLQNDRGIQAIMRQRKWSVGELTELTPFERTILGYNRNAGELIALRLRTDDLSGFRHYDSIRKVLLHELTHNVWSEHDDNFHALNRQLNKDVISLDWTAHGANLLGSGEFYDPEEDLAPSWQGGTYRLGGSSDAETISHRHIQRELALKAAMSRLTKQEEQELDEGCGSQSHTHLT